MGVSTREHGLLKLVHPGRHVEIHTKPITAAEILEKYPRFCIARPDVFKFPWIVVRPESLLLPGKVFYLVPHHTLYDLLKNKGENSQPDSRENQFSRDRRDHDHHRCRPGQNSQIKCWGGITPNQCKHHQYESRNRRRLQNMFRDRTNSHDQDSEGYQSDTSYVDAWSQVAVAGRLRKLRPTTTCQASTLDSSFDNNENVHPRRLRNSSVNVVLNLRVTFGPPIIIPVR